MAQNTMVEFTEMITDHSKEPEYSLNSSNIKITANIIKQMENFDFEFTDLPGNGYETVEFHNRIIA